jgi:hypothetical protein
MPFGHEKLDAKRAAIESVGWAERDCEHVKGQHNPKDQILCAW